MRLMMPHEIKIALAFLLKAFVDLSGEKQFLMEPDGKGHRKRTETSRREGQPGFDEAVKREKRFIVISDVVDLVKSDPGGLQAIADRMNGEIPVMLDAREALFLGGRHNVAVTDQAGRGVMIESGNAEDIHLFER